MKEFRKAISHDINNKISDALFYYNKAIRVTPLVVDAYVNSAFIYWYISFDYGFYSGSKKYISSEDYEKSYDMYSVIILKAKEIFPDNSEVLFWERFFKHMWNDYLFTEKACIDIISKGNEPSYVPYFFLYQQSNEKEYLTEIMHLKRIITELPTVKNRYILSLL